MSGPKIFPVQARDLCIGDTIALVEGTVITSHVITDIGHSTNRKGRDKFYFVLDGAEEYSFAELGHNTVHQVFS